MRILRFDSVGGASGDMILGALVGLGVDIDLICSELKKLLPDEEFSFVKGTKTEFGASGVYLTVDIPKKQIYCHEKKRHSSSHHGSDGHDEHAFHHHHGRCWKDIRTLIEVSRLDPQVKEDSLKAFKALAEAEAEAHCVPIDNVHFHEIGAVDSIIDTVGCVMGLRMLNIDGISLSPLPIGEGTFHCAHGTYPLPAPAVANLIQKYHLPVSYDVEPCEMLTPTAASIFSIWNKQSIPVGSTVIKSANSFGTHKMKSRPNLLRASIIETSDESCSDPYLVEQVYELRSNIDDATGERLSYLSEILFKAGALDVWYEPIYMKKGRPATCICTLVKKSCRSPILDLIFRHSGVLGIREVVHNRYALTRRWEEVDTIYGKARIKIGSNEQGEILVQSPEFEDCKRLADDNGLPLETIYREILQCFSRGK